MPSFDTVVTSLGSVRSHTRQVAYEIANRIGPFYFIWGMGASGEHSEGRALDFMTYSLGGGVNSPGPMRDSIGNQTASYLWDNRDRLDVWYVIWQQRIISINDNKYGLNGVWHKMEDRGNATANHIDHVHVSFKNDAAYVAPVEVEDMPTAGEIVTALLTRKMKLPNGTETTYGDIIKDTRSYSYNAAKARDTANQILTVVRAHAAQEQVDVDEVELANALAPLILTHLSEHLQDLTPEEVDAIAVAVNNELARRAAS